MICHDEEKVKPLDETLEDKAKAFESGKDAVCDKDLDTMMWELGDYENEEPPAEAERFEEEPPIEDELIEKTLVVSGTSNVSFKEPRAAEETISSEEKLAVASSIGPERRTRKPAPRSTRGKRTK